MQSEVIEIEIDAAKEAIKKRDTVLKLLNNNAYKEIVEEGYLKEEALRLVDLAGEALPKEQLESVKRLLAGIPCFKKYIRQIMIHGQNMQDALGEMEETRDAILEEEN